MGECTGDALGLDPAAGPLGRADERRRAVRADAAGGGPGEAAFGTDGLGVEGLAGRVVEALERRDRVQGVGEVGSCASSRSRPHAWGDELGLAAGGVLMQGVGVVDAVADQVAGPVQMIGQRLGRLGLGGTHPTHIPGDDMAA